MSGLNKDIAPMVADELRRYMPDFVEVVRCGKCRHYQGNHDVPGCAPCGFWGIGAVMWDDYCKRGERYDTD